MLQKIIQVGNSLAVTIPREFVKGRKLKAGEYISVDADSDMDMVIIRKNHKAMANLTPEFKKWLYDFTEEHNEALGKLAKL